MEPSEKNKTARRKRRPSQHVMEEQSRQIVRAVLPSHWVIHDFDKPDYGIDLVIEVFEQVGKTFETLGEFLYVQAKSVTSAKIEKVKVYPVANVARQPWMEDKSRWIDCDVVKFPLETDLLYTVQTMGTSVSVLLFVVDLATHNTYFLCLNDYIDKYLMPSNPGFWDQETVTLYIPAVNILGCAEGETALAFYGKRGKFLSSFSKFQYHGMNWNTFLPNRAGGSNRMRSLTPATRRLSRVGSKWCSISSNKSSIWISGIFRTGY
jgi:hypothetical protein